MPKAKVKNPFYLLLLVVGTLFAITACGYGAMTVRMIEPQALAAGDRFFDTYGLWLMLGELGLLAVLTFLAIGTDDYWVRRAEAKTNAKIDEDRLPCRRTPESSGCDVSCIEN